MQIQPLTSIPCHYLPRPVSDGRRPFDTRAAALVSSSPPHVLGQKFQPFNYPSPPMSSPPSPPRSYIPTTSASEGQRSSQDVGRGAPAPPHTGSPSTTAFRRETIPASAALLSPGQYPSTTRTLYSPGPPPTLGQGTLLDSAHYFPQRAALSPRTAGVGIVQTEFGRPAAGPLRGGTRSSRRGKTHVQKACINCKKAHLSCDAQRPCARCVASGKQDTCQDVEHKKRGRPRLRDDRDSRQSRDIAAADQGRILGEAQGAGLASLPPGHRRTQSGRILRSQQRASVGAMVQPIQSDPRVQRHTITGAQPQPSSSFPPRRGPEARIFMTLNFRIVRANQYFLDQFAPGSDVAGRELIEFVDHRHEPDIQRLITDFRHERNQMDPLSLPTIYSGEERSAIEGINEEEIGFYTSGTQERAEQWTFIQAGRQFFTRQLFIQLGKVGNFPFVVMTLPHYASSSLPAAPVSAFGQVPAVPQIPMQYEPVYLQRSPGTSSGYPHTGSGPSTPSLSLQSLASSLPPTSASVTSYPLPSAQGYFHRTQPSTQPPPPSFDPTAAFGHPPSLYSASSRPTSTVSEPFGSAARPGTSSSRPISLPGQPRTFQTMQAESEGSRTPGEPQGETSQEDEDARKRRRLNIREITD